MLSRDIDGPHFAYLLFCINISMASPFNSGQKISTSVGFTKFKAMLGKCGKKISSSEGFTKIMAMVGK